MQGYIRPKKILGSSLAFNLKKGPVICVKVCYKSWVMLTYSFYQFQIFFSITRTSETRSENFGKNAISYPDDTNCDEKKNPKKKIGTFEATIMYWQQSQEVHFVTLRENRG